MMTTTTDFKELAKKLIPVNHICIKYNERLARVGIICDNCITRLRDIVVEFGLMKKEEVI